MTQIISVANQKGGVGKTTTSINLSACLSFLGKKILLVDCDSQANATTGVGIDKQELKASLYHGLIGEADINDIIYPCSLPTMKIIPADVDLIGFEVEMISEQERQTKIRNLLAQTKDEFDFIILDCPPALSLMTLNAFTASNSVLIPLQSEFYALEGLGQLLNTIKRVKTFFNSRLKIKGILLTMYDNRTNLAKHVFEDVSQHFSNIIFKTKIPRNVKLGEAPSYGMPVILYDKNSSGAKSYLNFAGEFLKK